MIFWKDVQIAGELGNQLHLIIGLLLLLALLLGLFVHDARPRLRISMLLLIVSEVGTLICGWFLFSHFSPEGELYRTFHLAAAWCLTVATVTLASVLLFRVLLPAVRLDPPAILTDTLIGVVYFVAALALLSHHGVNLSGIIATSAVLTAVIGLSLQDTLGNVMNGIAMQLERSVAVGDWVRMGEIEGVVRQIRWRQTTIETRDWDAVVIPNSLLMKSQIVVLGKRQSGQYRLRRVAVTFNVDFRHSPSEVIDAVETALQLQTIPGVAEDPEPQCILTKFADSYGIYAARFWTSDFSRIDPISSEVLGRVYVALRRGGIRLSIPAATQFLKMHNRRHGQAKREQDIRRKAQALKSVPIFQPLTDEERTELAARLTVAPFRRGEVLTRQGQEGHFLYLIAQGETEVAVHASNGGSQQLATLGPGDVVGEMALLTGEPRSATVVARTDVTCYRLDKEAFKETIESRPAIADAISHLLARRRLQLDEAARGLTVHPGDQSVKKVQNELLAKIRHFFLLN